MSINFPNPGDTGYTGSNGISCEVYSYGFTSGCTDDDGNNRGFTQNWYFDKEIGAWVSVTKSTSDATEIRGATYEGFTHASPTYVAGTTGIIRKVSFLDPETGSLTFDFIKLHDLVGPNEALHTYSGTWLSATNNIFDSEGSSKYRTSTLSQDGVTLCAPGGHTYSIFQASNTNTGIRISFNVQDNGEVSPFGEAAPTNAQIQFAGRGTALTEGLVGGLTLPFAYTPSNGINNIEIEDTHIAFTADGPTKKAAKLTTSYDRPGAGGTENRQISGEIGTENEYYIFLSSTGDMDYYATGNAGATDQSHLIKNSAAAGFSAETGIGLLASAGLVGLLPNAPGGLPDIINHNIDIIYTKADFNLESAASAPGFIYVAMPSRVNISASGDLFANVSDSPQGFSPSDVKTIAITNDNGYGENYDLFKSLEPNGFNLEAGSNIFKIKTT